MKTLAKGIKFVLACFILFIPLEVFSHLILPDGKLGTLESIFNIREEDPVLFWRQRAHLKTEFQGVKVMTNSLGLRKKEIAIVKPKVPLGLFVLAHRPRLVGVISGQKKQELSRPVFSEASGYGRNIQSVQKDGWKFIVSKSQDGLGLGPKVELYNLGADPAETRDLSGSKPLIVKSLSKLLAARGANNN